MPAKATARTTPSAEEELKLAWIFIGSLAQSGRINGITWNFVIEKTDAEDLNAAKNIWYRFRDRMGARLFKFPKELPRQAAKRAPAKKAAKATSKNGPPEEATPGVKKNGRISTVPVHNSNDEDASGGSRDEDNAEDKDGDADGGENETEHENDEEEEDIDQDDYEEK